MRPKHVRKWLNKDKTLEYGGYIMWSVIPPQNAKGNDRYVDAQLIISDCSHVVRLSIDTSEPCLDNTIYKLDTLINEIIEFKITLLKAKNK